MKSIRAFAWAAPLILVAAAACTTASEPSQPAGTSYASAGGPNRIAGLIRVRHVDDPSVVAPRPATANNRLDYHNGSIVSAAKVYAVDWGPNVDATVKQGMPGFYQAILGSDYLAWLSEYDTNIAGGTNQHLGPASFVSSLTITPKNTSTTIDDTTGAIGVELGAQFDAGALPKPEYDAQGYPVSLYMIDFPAGITIIAPGNHASCTYFCAYHGSAYYQGKPFMYGVHPDLGGACAGGCGNYGSIFNNSTAIHSHELIEALTDPLTSPAGWYENATGNEIADICDGPGVDMKYNGYYVEPVWSNQDGDCIVLRPICNAPQNPTNAPCRACTAADDNLGYGCNGAKPYCATGASDPKKGTCVECRSTDECSGTKPVCDTTDVCRTCQSNSECPATAPICETSGPLAGRCLQCDANDKSSCKAPTAACDTSIGRCAACTSSADCSGATPICDTSTDTCRGCDSNADCTGKGVCDTASDAEKGQCVQCNADADCMAPAKCNVAMHTCAACASNASCSNPKPICDGMCRICKSDAECAGSKSGDLCETNGALSGACVKCTAQDASACTGDTPVCDGDKGTCVACVADADCKDATKVCSTTRQCVPCGGMGQPACAAPPGGGGGGGGGGCSVATIPGEGRGAAGLGAFALAAIAALTARRRRAR